MPIKKPVKSKEEVKGHNFCNQHAQELKRKFGEAGKKEKTQKSGEHQEPETTCSDNSYSL